MDSDQVVNEVLERVTDLLLLAIEQKLFKSAPAASIARLADAVVWAEEAKVRIKKNAYI